MGSNELHSGVYNLLELRCVLTQYSSTPYESEMGIENDPQRWWFLRTREDGYAVDRNGAQNDCSTLRRT